LNVQEKLLGKLSPERPLSLPRHFFADLAREEYKQLAHASALAERLVERGVGFVTIHHCERQGWDMHGDLPEDLRILGGHLDVALTQLILGTREKGYIVVCTSEFGRTMRIYPARSGGGGSDHLPVHFLIGAGGKFKRGTVWGDYYHMVNREHHWDGVIRRNPVRNEDLAPTIIRAAGGKVDPMNRGVDAVLA
jgi:uncharacterized protein (DUF1501 family)